MESYSRQITGILRPIGSCRGWLRLAIVWLVAGMAFAPASLKAAPFKSREKGKETQEKSSSKESPSDKGDEESDSDDAEANIRLNYMNVGWNKVLKDLSETTGMPLVADRVPSTKYSRRDKQKYQLNEALKILNQDLEKHGYRLIKKGNYLVVVDLPALRNEYPRPTIGAETPSLSKSNSAASNAPSAIETAGKGDREEGGVKTAAGIRKRAELRKVGLEETKEESPAGSSIDSEQESDSQSSGNSSVIREVALSNSSAVTLAKSLYQVFKGRAELLDVGPLGLQAFRVFETDHHGIRTQSVSFTLGIDDREERLVVEATPDVAAKVADLIELLDRGVQGKKVQPVATRQNPLEVARNLQPQIDQLAAADEPTRLDAPETEVAQKPEVPLNQGEQKDAPKAGEKPPLDGLKGDVSIEAMSDLGVLILKGSQRDVDSVMKIIREIEKLSLGATPNVDLVMLSHVNSESLSALLNSVYEKLHASRVRTSGPGVGNTNSRISSIPVVKPNAILVLAPADEMPNVLKLVEELDQPVPPETEYRVFRLQHTTPSRVEAMIEKLYAGSTEGGQPPGLATRVRAYGDVRTNSVVIQARPRDIAEVESLIRKLDVAETGAVSQLKIIALKHANADELATTLRLAIQSVNAPPASQSLGQNQGFQQGGGAQGGGAGTSPELTEAKSTILQFLSIHQGAPLRSGLLTDIRVNSDPRTNSLVVSAPEQSMTLIEAIVKNLDRPASAVAEIKVFELARGDATAMAQLLGQIFNTTGSGTNQNGTGGQATGNRPIAIAGSEDGGTQIPLKVSVDVRTNSIIATGSSEALKVAEAILLRLDQSDIRQRETVVIRLKNSQASDVAEAVNEFLTSRRDVEQQSQGLVSPFEQIEKEVVVVPELGSNSLIISATPRFFDEIKKTVERLDESPRQVIIQALLVEVGLDNADEFGVELGLQDSILFRRSAITDAVSQLITIDTTTTELGTQTTSKTIVSQSAEPGYNFNNAPLGNNTNAGLNTGAVGTQGLSNFQLGRTNADLGYGGFVFSASSESVSVLLRALAANRRVDILSRPQIRALDNQEAQIQVGQEVPRVVNFSPNATTGVSTPLIEQTPTGIILNVTPRISPDRTIVMRVAASKSSIAPGAGVTLITNPNGSVVSSPILDKAEALTTISVRDSQTIVLGGMITKNDENIERKVPYLGDIPVVGTLFRYDYSRSRRSELLIFLTPRIISSDEDSELIKQIETERIHFIESEAEQIHGPILAAPAAFDDGYCPPEMLPLTAPSYDDEYSIPKTTPEAGQLQPPLPGDLEIVPPPAPPAVGEPIEQMDGTEVEPELDRNTVAKPAKSGIRRIGFTSRKRPTETAAPKKK